jgi:tetratricopeptide (TPR) repeat protein
MVYSGESIAAGYAFLSTMYQSLHQFDLAIASLLKALDLLKKFSSSSLSLDSEMLAIEEKLVALYSEMRDYSSALVHSCEILHILEKTKPWCKQQIASIQNNIGWFYYEVGDLDNALVSCQKSFELSQECFQSSNTNQINSELTYVLNSLGHIYLKSGDQTNALDYCQKSLQALEHENETGQYMKAFADNYELLADIYMQYGRQTLSFDYYLKALQLYRQWYVTKKDHPDIQRILTLLKNINEIEF